MDDTITSDPGTFVSVDNFMVSPSPSPARLSAAHDAQPTQRHSGTPSHLAPDAVLYEASSSSGPPDRASFIWSLNRNTEAPEASDNDFTEGSDVCRTFGSPDGVSPMPAAAHLVSDDFADPELSENNTLLFADEAPLEVGAGQLDNDDYGGDSSQADDMTGNTDDYTRDAEAEEQLLQATAGMTAFHVDNPFNLLPASEDPSARVLLHSVDGPMNEEEIQAVKSIAENRSSPLSQVLSKFFQTITFQQQQLSNLMVSTQALRSQSQRFSDVHRRRSYVMNTLISDLDEERRKGLKLQEENDALKLSLSQYEERDNQVVTYCKQFNPRFSMDSGVVPALESMFAVTESALRESEQRDEEKTAEVEELNARVVELDEQLAESVQRYEESQSDILMLQQQLSALEGQSVEPYQDFSVTGRRSTSSLQAWTAERQELNGKLREKCEQVSALQKDLVHSQEDKIKVDNAILNLNVELEMVQTKRDTYQKQRDTAERNCRKAEKLLREEKNKITSFSKEFSINISDACHDLEEKESQIRLQERQIQDRDSVVQELQISVSELEDQLAKITNAAIEYKKDPKTTSSRKGEISVISDAVVKSLRADVTRAQNLLAERSDQAVQLKDVVSKLEENVISLRKERDRYCAMAAMRATLAHRAGDTHAVSEQHNNFLRRLSSKLGVPSESNREMVSKLLSRVDHLMKERKTQEAAMVRLRSETHDRERTLHVVQSEMQAEISTLKADIQYLENMKNRAAQDRQFAEKKLLEVLGEKDFSKADSIGDITASSFGTRRLSEGESVSRRESMFSIADSEHKIHWSDPLVQAAIQSFNGLIELKDDLAARLRALHERMDRLLKRGQVTNTAGSDLREVMIESRGVQADLAGVVDMQHGIIDTLRGHALGPDGTVIPGAEDSLPYIQGHASFDTTGDNGRISGDISAYSSAGLRADRGTELGVVPVNGIGEAAGFLREQLKQTRELYNEKSRANAQLCGVIAELRQELENLNAQKNSTEDLLTQVSENHQSFVSRLSTLVGAEVSIVAVEDHVRFALQNAARLSENASAMERRSVLLMKNVANLAAQKRILAHMIDMYQSKYHLNLLMSSKEDSSLKRRFRTVVRMVIAACRLSNSTSRSAEDVEEIDISSYDVPDLAAIGRHFASGVAMVNATVAISAVPRLESALLEREKQINDLKSTISAFEDICAPPPEDVRNTIQSSFAYSQDIVNRKEDLARRLRKALREKSDMEMQLSREREIRIAAEAKLARYSERLLVAKKKLGKANAHAESKERTYKAAIKYMKRKADKAVEQDGIGNENADPWASPQSQAASGTPKANTPSVNADSLMVLSQTLAQTEIELQAVEPGSSKHQELTKYIQGLHKAIHRLRHPRKTKTQGPSIMDRNVVA